MWPRSWAFHTCVSWSLQAFLTLFKVTICCLTQNNKEIEWPSLWKPSPHLRSIQTLCKWPLISGDNQAVGSLEFKGNLFPELCFCVSSWQVSILPLSLLSACTRSLLLYFVIFMAMIIELHRISWNPTGFWMLSRCLRLGLRASFT